MLYLVKSGEFYKIGYTRSKNVAPRIAGMQTGNPVRIEFVAMWEGDQKDEEALHGRFTHRRVHGEWFSLTAEDLKDLHAFMAAYVPEDIQPPRRAKPPNPLALPELKFPDGIVLEIDDDILGCTWCGSRMFFLGDINFLYCKRCDHRFPMGPIIVNRDRRRAVESTMYRNCIRE